MKSVQIHVSDKILLASPVEKVLSYLWDIQNLAFYEPKVDEITVDPENHTYQVKRGRFAGIPWKGTFSYRRNSDGFTSEILNRPLGVFVTGGFQVKEKEGGSEVRHFEAYSLPRWLFPIRPFVRFYLKRALKLEMRNVAEGVFQTESK